MSAEKKDDLHPVTTGAGSRSKKALAKAFDAVKEAADKKDGTAFLHATADLCHCCDQTSAAGGKVRGTTAEVAHEDVDECEAAVVKFERSVTGGRDRLRAAAGASAIPPEVLNLGIQLALALLSYFRNK